MGTVLTEGKRLSDVVKSEADGRYSRDAVTVLGGVGADRVLEIGTVTGAVVLGSASVAADGGNTGDGTITGITLGSKAQAGDYVLTCVEAAANGGVFEVMAPDGDRLSDGVVGAAEVGDHLSFTINDGAADFVVGDKFTITVAEGSNKILAIDFDAEDGSQNAHGLMAVKVTAPDGVDMPGVEIARHAEIVESGLVWPAGATADQKAAALAQLEAKGIIARKEA
jgi:hypothetical protein